MTSLLLAELILAFGIVQSILALFKDTNKQIYIGWIIKRDIKICSIITKFQAGLYILAFGIGFYLLCVNNTKDIKSSYIQSSIHSIVSNQFDSLKKLAKANSLIIKTTDSVNQHLISQNRLTVRLNLQYEKINSQLLKQVVLEEKKYNGLSPLINMRDYDVHWIDTTINAIKTTSLELYIRNFGNRNALILRGKGFVLFFNKNNKTMDYIDIPGDRRESILKPENNIQSDCLRFSTYGISNFQEIKTNSGFAIVFLKLFYKDIGMSKDADTNIKYFYSGWTPTSPDFGTPKDWQINLTKEWAIKNDKY